MTPKNDNSNQEASTLYSTDGSFTIKPRKIRVKKGRRKIKKDVKVELDNTKLDMIE